MQCFYWSAIFCVEEKQRIENTDDRVPLERGIDEWLSRREKKKSASAAKGYAPRFSHLTPRRTRLARRKVTLAELELKCCIIYVSRLTKTEEEEEEEEEQEDQVERDMRQQLRSIPDLPPSLLPPPPGGWKVNVHTEWG